MCGRLSAKPLFRWSFCPVSFLSSELFALWAFCPVSFCPVSFLSSELLPGELLAGIPKTYASIFFGSHSHTGVQKVHFIVLSCAPASKTYALVVSILASKWNYLCRRSYTCVQNIHLICCSRWYTDVHKNRIFVVSASTRCSVDTLYLLYWLVHFKASKRFSVLSSVLAWRPKMYFIYYTLNQSQPLVH